MSVRDDVKSEDKKPERTARQNVKRATKGQKKEHFKVWKMWISYLLSLTMKDRGKIPDNIGNRILITNNLVITKLYMTEMIMLYELGDNTPCTLLQVINEELRKRGNQCVVDLTLKNKKYNYDPKNSGLASRVSAWSNVVDSPEQSKNSKKRAARCLYTVKRAEQGDQLKYTRAYLYLRAKDIRTLTSGEKIVFDLLGTMGCVYNPIYSNIKEHLAYACMIGGKAAELKDLTPMMTNNATLADICPNTGSFNDRDGDYVGINVLNGSEFFVNFPSITEARNMYVCAPSGVGKTVLALNLAQSKFENGQAVCLMDIKGNEFNNFIKATGGYIVSLRPESIEFINSWVMHKEDVDASTAESYFRSRVQFSKQQMIILSGLKDREMIVEFEQLLDEFHDALYTSVGVRADNVNSWKFTEQFNPYIVFDYFINYLTPQKMAQYNLNKTVIGTLRMYMSSGGSKSYIFKQEFDYASILNAPTLSFDFGLLSGGTKSDVDEDLFRLKFLYMSKLNGDFVQRKYASGIRTFKVLEESQIVSDSVLEMYVQEWTLRRSQQQDTMLLGNSVQALESNKIAKPIIENTRALFIGELTKEAREIVLKEFGIQHLEEYVKLPGSNSTYKNSFFMVNMMQPKVLYPLIKVILPDQKKRRYKVFVPTKEKNVMSGS